MPALLDGPRRAVAASVRRSLGAGEGDLDAYRRGPGDPGLFGPGSVVWTVHGDLASMLVGGIAALLAQTLHPLAMAGVAAHSRYREDRMGRLQRTARFIAGTTYGSRELAAELVAEVRAVHATVRGTAPDGRPYRADDPELLRFVHVCEVDSFLAAFQRYGPRPLLRDEKDRYFDEVAVTAEMLGATNVPRSLDEVRAYRRAILPELARTDQAVEALKFLREPASEAVAERAAHHVLVAAAEDLLPSDFRRLAGVGPRGRIAAAPVRAAALSLALGLRWAIGPSLVRQVAETRVRAEDLAGGPGASTQ